MVAPLDSGNLSMAAWLGALPREASAWSRLHAIPFTVVDDVVSISSVGDSLVQLVIPIKSGRYRLWVGQQLAEDADELCVSLGFEQTPELLKDSQILVADTLMNPQYPLEEWTQWPT